MFSDIVCKANCAAYVSTPWIEFGQKAIIVALFFTMLWESITYIAALLVTSYAVKGWPRAFLKALLTYFAIRLSALALYASVMHFATSFFVDYYSIVSAVYMLAKFIAIITGFAITVGDVLTAIKILLVAGFTRLVFDWIPPMLYQCTCMGRTVVAIRLGSLMGSTAYVVAAYLAARRWCCTPRRGRAWTGWWRHV